MRPDEIIIKPIVTEKSTMLRESQNKYLFVVHKNSNKISIKEAIRKLFNITPIDVNIINVKGKRKRVRYRYGYTSSYKKAIISLDKNDKIGLFEGA